MKTDVFGTEERQFITKEFAETIAGKTPPACQPVTNELSEDTQLMLKHPELIEPVMSCVQRFHDKTGKLPRALLVSMEVWNRLGRARQFEGMYVICDLNLKGESVYCTTEECLCKFVSDYAN